MHLALAFRDLSHAAILFPTLPVRLLQIEIHYFITPCFDVIPFLQQGDCKMIYELTAFPRTPHTECGPHPVSYSTNTGRYFHADKAAGA